MVVHGDDSRTLSDTVLSMLLTHKSKKQPIIKQVKYSVHCLGNILFLFKFCLSPHPSVYVETVYHCTSSTYAWPK